jgi:hopanoid biosynthesis associated protein HpnK
VKAVSGDEGMKRLIVNADDFGLTEGVNRAVIEGHVHGIITSTSLLANGVAFDSAVTMSKSYAQLGVGVHLNLTDGRPVSVPSEILSLLNSQKLFVSGAVRQAKRILTGRANLSEVEREFRSQIEKARAAGVRITHLDGHQHLHLLPPIVDIVINLAREFGIGAIRCSAERPVEVLQLMGRNRSSSAEVLKQFLTGRALAVLSSNMRQRLCRAGLKCPDHFYGLTQTGFLDATAVQKILQHLSQGTSELMCHPGYVDADLANTLTRLLGQREKELRALTNPAVKRLVTEQTIQLVNYGSMAEGS